MEPSPPDQARERAPAPRGGLKKKKAEPDVVIPFDKFQQLVTEIRTNQLLGPNAADALLAAAGLCAEPSSPGSAATELRSKVADSREDEEKQEEKPKKKKKAMMFAAEEPAEIPQVEEIPPPEEPAQEDEPPQEAAADDEPELNLNPKQNKMRTDLEMWVMDEVPMLFGVDDSEELDESLQEDGQSLKITQLIAETSPEKQKANLEAWLAQAPEAKDEFIVQCLEKVQAIQDAGAKKKKKKKKVEAE